MMNTLPLWISLPASLFLVISGVLTLMGSIGLLRLNSFYRRIHAPTLGNTFGVFGMVMASILVSSALEERIVVHQILLTLFLIITAPVSTMLLMRAAIRRKLRAAQKQQDGT